MSRKLHRIAFRVSGITSPWRPLRDRRRLNIRRKRTQDGGVTGSTTTNFGDKGAEDG